MENIDKLSDEKWFEMLLESTRKPVVDGIEFPLFPTDAVQSQFVGSSNEDAMREGFQFYKTVKGYASALGRPFGKDSRFLDFGCGWGRFLRIFMKDIAAGNLYGVDIDPTILDECKKNKVPGNLDRIFPDSKLPHVDGFFDCVIAYSVFTHLPENVHTHWVQELARVARPGCVFVLTLESSRFLDFVEGLASGEPKSAWHAGLRKFSKDVPAHRKSYKAGKFVYLPTGGGDFRSADVYGDAVVSEKYIKKTWSKYFNIIEYIDDPDRFWQAVLIVQRK